MKTWLDYPGALSFSQGALFFNAIEGFGSEGEARIKEVIANG
jgi:hypothetical protein